MSHPLEPLSATEVSRAVSRLAARGKLVPTTRVVSVMLEEPPKAAVHAGTNWTAEAPVPSTTTRLFRRSRFSGQADEWNI